MAGPAPALGRAAGLRWPAGARAGPGPDRTEQRAGERACGPRGGHSGPVLPSCSWLDQSGGPDVCFSLIRRPRSVRCTPPRPERNFLLLKREKVVRRGGPGQRSGKPRREHRREPEVSSGYEVSPLSPKSEDSEDASQITGWGRVCLQLCFPICMDGG